MDRVRGKRFDEEPKLNIKKVIASIITVIVIIMVILSIKKLFKKQNTVVEMNIPTAYFTIYQDGKYGVINSNGNVVIKPTYDEMIVIPNFSKDVFWTCKVDSKTGDLNAKVLNSANKEILTKYNNIKPIENFDNNEIWYEDNIFIFEENGLFGLVDFSGKKIVEPEYTNIYALDGIAKSIVIEKNGTKGIVNSSLGTIAIDCTYDDISSLNTSNATDGYIVRQNGLYGVVSATGKVILGCNYSEIEHVYGNDMYVVKEGNTLKIIDNALNVIKEGEFDSVKSIDGENIIIEKGGLYGVISKSGEEKIPVKYEDLSFACDTYYIAKNDGLYGIISTDDIVRIDFKYQSINFLTTTNFYQAENSNYKTDIINKKLEVKLSDVIISELNIDKAYMRVRIDGKYKYYNFNFEEKSNIDVLKTNTLFLVSKDGKYGYVNKNGDLIVDYIYDDAKEQNMYGYCVVKQKGKWGVLAQDGTVILKPSVNLDDNLYIDFISSWHLYKDTDLNIYVK